MTIRPNAAGLPPGTAAQVRTNEEAGRLGHLRMVDGKMSRDAGVRRMQDLEDSSAEVAAAEEAETEAGDLVASEWAD